MDPQLIVLSKKIGLHLMHKQVRARYIIFLYSHLISMANYIYIYISDTLFVVDMKRPNLHVVGRSIALLWLGMNAMHEMTNILC